MSPPEAMSEQQEFERKLTALHDVATDLSKASSAESVYRHTIEASEEILSFDTSVVGIVEDGVIYPRATSSGVDPDGVGPIPVERGLGGRTYRTGESVLVRDVAENEHAEPKGAYASAISVPIGEHGNFQAVSERTDAFDEADLQLAELLVQHATSALDRLRRERQLQRQKERLEEYASVVAHDIRNPLEVAKGHVTLGKQSVDGDTEEHLEAATAALDRMELLTSDLLTLARQGERPMDPEPVALEDVVEACWDDLRTDEASLVVETERTIRADPHSLRRLLENLFRNAVQHGGGDVTVTVGDLPDRPGFHVTDDGPGIPDGKHESVFEAGYSTTEKGTGLGLRIVREAADAHGWAVTATDGVDGGARFEVVGVDVD